MRIIYGRRPVFEALSSGEMVKKVYLLRGIRKTLKENISKIINEKQIGIIEVNDYDLQKLTNSPNNQGIAAEIEEVKYAELSDILNSSKGKSTPIILLLDSIQDPGNLGAILRSAESAGVDGVVLTIHNSAPITNVVEKTSAGAVGHLKICRVNNLVSVITQLKNEGYWIVGTVMETETSIYDLDYNRPTAIIVGNEEKGLRRLVKENCDFLVKIPMFGNIQSLNVSVSTGIILYEVLRQNKALSNSKNK